jgi:hypothetical protein
MRLSLLIIDYSSISYGNGLFLLDNLAYSIEELETFVGVKTLKHIMKYKERGMIKHEHIPSDDSY